METRLKQRMIGAVVLTTLAIIILPMLLDGSAQDRARVVARIPQPPTIQLKKMTVADVDRRMKEMEAESAARVPHLSESPSGAAPAGDKAAAGTAVGAPDGSKGALSLDRNDLPVGWTLQLGAFRDHKNALRLRDDLRASHYRTYIIAAQSDQGDVYRVFVGPMLERARLDEIGKQIETRFELKGQIVRYRIEDDAEQLGG